MQQERQVCEVIVAADVLVTRVTGDTLDVVAQAADPAKLPQEARETADEKEPAARVIVLVPMARDAAAFLTPRSPNTATNAAGNNADAAALTDTEGVAGKSTTGSSDRDHVPPASSESETNSDSGAAAAAEPAEDAAMPKKHARGSRGGRKVQRERLNKAIRAALATAQPVVSAVRPATSVAPTIPAPLPPAHGVFTPPVMPPPPHPLHPHVATAMHHGAIYPTTPAAQVPTFPAAAPAHVQPVWRWV